MDYPKENEVNPSLENDNEMALEACAEDMLKSIGSKNVKSIRLKQQKNFHSLYDESNGKIMTTLAELEGIREQADQQSSQFISDSELTGYINNSYAELYSILVSKFEDYFMLSLDFEIASGNSFTVPSDVTNTRY